MKANTKTLLATTRHGRVLLHLACLIRHPSHTRWHFQGILREFSL